MSIPCGQAATADERVVCHDKIGIPFEVRCYGSADRITLQHFYEDFEPKRAAQGLPPPDGARIRGWLDSILARGLHLLAFRDGELIGHAFVAPTARAGIGEYAVFLRQDVRGQGVGTELNRTAAAAAKDRGFAGLWLTVEPTNRAAIRSYEKAGFRFVPWTVFLTETEMELPL